jgi:hypothetical protein
LLVGLASALEAVESLPGHQAAAHWAPGALGMRHHTPYRAHPGHGPNAGMRVSRD